MLECSDSDSSDPNKKAPWHERKQAYLEHLKAASPDALPVSAADKLHNARDILACYRELGDEVWSRFNKKAGKEDQLRYYRALVTEIGSAGAPPGLVEELDRVVTQLETLAGLPLAATGR